MYSPQVGSPVAFYTLHFEPQSGGDLKRFSVSKNERKIHDFFNYNRFGELDTPHFGVENNFRKDDPE